MALPLCLEFAYLLGFLPALMAARRARSPVRRNGRLDLPTLLAVSALLPPIICSLLLALATGPNLAGMRQIFFSTGDIWARVAFTAVLGVGSVGLTGLFLQRRLRQRLPQPLGRHVRQGRSGGNSCAHGLSLGGRCINPQLHTLQINCRRWEISACVGGRFAPYRELSVSPPAPKVKEYLKP